VQKPFPPLRQNLEALLATLADVASLWYVINAMENALRKKRLEDFGMENAHTWYAVLKERKKERKKA
jgi:hypothetical protein